MSGENTSQERKRKSANEKAETEKKLDQARGQTRVNVGTAFQWWSQRASETMP